MIGTISNHLWQSTLFALATGLLSFCSAGTGRRFGIGCGSVHRSSFLFLCRSL